MKEASTTEETFFDGDHICTFPQHPFESIGFALSGGGFRAAAYGLGVLSVFDALKINNPGGKTLRLLDKVEFISSASGGTITLLVYTAALRKGKSFGDFFGDLNKKLTGEFLIHQALDILKQDSYWKDGEKKRNPINAFARAYHISLLDFLNEDEKCLDFIMSEDQGNQTTHLKEFCFNATEFYTGLSFRFQGSQKNWKEKKGGKLGNRNMGINWKDSENSFKTLRQIRLGDILASSSCFPLGFEPIIFPRDFSYFNGPQIEDLKQAVELKTNSWREGEQYKLTNSKSSRAFDEKKFVDKGEFGLMDGGICDNQGLISLMLANKRKKMNSLKEEKTFKSRFDLMMVSDVASFYMKPFSEPAVKGEIWNQKSIESYWNTLKLYQKNTQKWFSFVFYGVIAFNIASILILFLEGISFGSVLSEAVLLLLLAAIVYVKYKIRGIIRSRLFTQVLSSDTLEDLYSHYFPEPNFRNKTILRMIAYLKGVKTEQILNMIYTRVESAQTMISDVFLKQVRRLIYDQFFSNEHYKYRHVNNPIYRLSYTNDKNRRDADFEVFAEDEDKEKYTRRKEDFEKDILTYCRLTSQMQDLAEIAYSAPTTLWFSSEEETEGTENVRKAIIATGQFSTCTSLLRYTLSLRHSRNFSALSKESRQRIEMVLEQLKDMMLNFERAPMFLYDVLTDPKINI
ncbi:patatin-like phospholipase family protein [Flavobacterium sp. N502536]|uniref:patatin-like phospholipase family protein n=1 Tax=Flavobacterium sp. N502536 TaxID=2986837 RepID=UPI002223B0EB|nr:patatin-like phospholipase family protein [Flavobacterium sp. N502536]